MQPVWGESERKAWLNRLRLNTRVLLSGASTPAAITSAAAELYSLLSSAASGALSRARAAGPRTLPSGTAISPLAAARCTNDPIRTAMFIRGVAAAARELTAQLPGCALEVVYAGTGPLAPLVVPLIAAGELTNARVTFIDINETSVAAVRQLVELLASGGHAFVATDAATYRHGLPLHLLVTETMQRALTIEPQVAIATNLAGQLHDIGVMVPEQVRVDLCIEAPDGASEHCIGTIVDLSKKSIVRGDIGAPRRLAISRDGGRVFYRTSIQAYGDHYIAPRQSGLTMPEYVWDLYGAKEGEVITFWYQVDQRPRIRHRRESSAA